jgi:parallel beta-helix repeat protein
MMRPFLTGSLAAVLALTLLCAPAAARTQPEPPHCGQAITADTTLTANLTGCTGDGLVIAADGVTLDLAGHRIEGAASGDTAGVDVEGHTGVVIQNGTVRGFDEGVFALGARDLTVRRVRLSGSAHGGIRVDGGRDVTLRRNVVHRCGAGIIVTRSDRVVVAANRIGRSAFGGIPIFDSRHVLVVGNAVTTSRTDAAIGLFRGSSHTTVAGNRVATSAAGIVAAEGASHNVIAGNVAVNDGSGVILDVGTHDNRVIGNRIDGSAFEGIAVVASDDNVLARNHVARSGRDEPAGGIVVIPLPDDPSQTSNGNLLSRNQAIRNQGDGITVGAGQVGNVLRANVADRNSRLGIDAAAGTIDGGGNRAAHNGDPRGCVGVSCAV